MDELEKKQKEETQLVDNAFQHLIDTYLASPHRKKVELITKAFNFARKAHDGVRRLSGEPYIMHPISVAQIACEEMGLGSTSISAALLHDVVEDTDYTVDDIENIFGPKIAQLVDGLTKISGGIFGEQDSIQVANIKKLLLTMNEDIRVILIKICDRLHNMRTLESQPANKQYKIAGETQYIYAPIANRLGLNAIKTELENLSFRYEHPSEYENICHELRLTEEERGNLFEEFTTPIRKKLDERGYQYEIKARVKSPYSIWNKMQKQHVPFEGIYDILAVRIIFKPHDKTKEREETWAVFAAVSSIYKSKQDRLRTWIDSPKPNGYKALHATFMSNQGKWVEVQIRTEEMDEIAEHGYAAHWKYKEQQTNDLENAEQQPTDAGTETAATDIQPAETADNSMDMRSSGLDEWLRTITEILDDPQPDAMDFLSTLKLNLYASEIFIFTPKGQMITMPAGSTVIDFAFKIHTVIGNHCIGAKVNYKLVPASHKLQSGDQVEVLSSNSEHAKPEWLKFARTAKAKNKITKYVNSQRRAMQRKGEQMLREWLAENDIELTNSIENYVCRLHDIRKPETLYTAIGMNKIVLDDDELERIRNRRLNKVGWRRYVPFMKANDTIEEETIQVSNELLTVGKSFNKKIACRISEETFHMYIAPNCCHPIPGDDILGYINSDSHVEIHKRACPVANMLKTTYGNRILDAKWDMHDMMLFNATVEIHGIDRDGMLRDVANVLTNKLSVSIRKITVGSNDGIFEGTIEMKVHNRSEVKTIMNALKKIAGMQEVLQIM